MQTNRNLFSALKLEKLVMFIILTLIVLVAAFNIASTLIMVVMEKGRDIGILKSMGATNRSIRRIFVFEGLVIGGVGTAAGLIGGWLLCFLLERYQFIELPGDVYYIDTLPVVMEPQVFALVAVCAASHDVPSHTLSQMSRSNVNTPSAMRSLLGSAPSVVHLTLPLASPGMGTLPSGSLQLVPSQIR